MLDLRRLQTLREVVDRRSFSAAADALDYTQSSVSQQIAALEAQLGATLIDRARRPIAATPAGELVLARADALLGQAVALERDLADLAAGDAGTLRVAGFFTAWATFLPSAVERFSRRHPGVQLELTQLEPDRAAAGVLAGEVDLAVVYRYGDGDPEGTMATVLFDDPYAVAVPRRHPLAEREQVALADLADEQWVLPGADSTYGQVARRLCAQAGFQPQVGLETGDIAMVQPLVAAGLAVSLLPALGLVPRHPGVAVRPLRDLPHARTISVLEASGRRAPAAPAMVAELVGAARSARRRLG